MNKIIAMMVLGLSVSGLGMAKEANHARNVGAKKAAGAQVVVVEQKKSNMDLMRRGVCKKDKRFVRSDDRRMKGKGVCRDCKWDKRHDYRKDRFRDKRRDCRR